MSYHAVAGLGCSRSSHERHEKARIAKRCADTRFVTDVQMCVAEVGLLTDQGPTASVKMEGRSRTIPLFSRAKQGLTRLRTAGVDLLSTSSCTKQTRDACDEAAPNAPWTVDRGCCSGVASLVHFCAVCSLEPSNPLLTCALQVHISLPYVAATSADCKHRDRVGLTAAQYHPHALEAYPCHSKVQKDGIPHPVACSPAQMACSRTDWL